MLVVPGVNSIPNILDLTGTKQRVEGGEGRRGQERIVSVFSNLDVVIQSVSQRVSE